MIQYIERIILPYVNANRERSYDTAVVIMDNFKRQVITSLLPSNTTNQLQQVDLAVNKPAKYFLREKFQEWCSDQIWQQIDPSVGNDEQQLQPVNLSLPALQQSGWLKWQHTFQIILACCCPEEI